MVFLYLDAIALRVKIAKKVISVPVLVGLGVKGDGQKVILDLELFQSESTSRAGKDLSRGLSAAGSNRRA